MGGADMKPFLRRNHRLLLILPVFLLMMFGYQNCAVDLSSTTPGASTSTCAPTTEQLTAFEPVLNNILQKTGLLGATSKIACGQCHNDNSGNSANAVFMVFSGNTTTDPSLLTRNFCTIERVGPDVVTHPMQATGHGGGQYLEAEIQALYDFVIQNF